MAPRRVKTVEKPKTKATANLNTLIFSLFSSSIILSSEVPARKHKYPGTIGKTHGERKLNKPAKNTKANDISSKTYVFLNLRNISALIHPIKPAKNTASNPYISGKLIAKL